VADVIGKAEVIGDAEVDIAAINGPAMTVVSGWQEAADGRDSRRAEGRPGRVGW